MGANYSEIQELLQQRADIQARLNLMPYDGNPEIKEVSGTKYLYIRKRVAGRLTSTYVDVYSDELYQILLRNAKERKDLNKKRQKRAVKLPDFSFLTRFRIRVLLQNKINYLILFVTIHTFLSGL